MSIITNTNFLIQLLAGIFVGGVSGYLGSLMLSRKMTIVVDPLSHLALPGIALALILQKDVSVGAFLFLFFGTILIWFLEQKTKLPTETIIAILFSVTLASTFLFLSKEEIEEAVFGDISKMGPWEGIITILSCFFIFFLIKNIYSKLTLILVSEDLAKSEGVNVKKIQFLYLFAIALMVALAVKFVGGLLIAGLVSLPPASAKNLTKNLKSYKIFSILIGLSAVFLGIFLAKFYHLPIGSLIILLLFLIFLVSLIFKR